MVTSIAIAPEEHADRCAALLAHAQAEGLAGVVLFDPTYVLYYSGFAFVPTERPIAFVLASDGTRALVVPRLELEHAESRSTLDRVEHYLEYPGDPRAEDVLTKTSGSREPSARTRTAIPGSSATAGRRCPSSPAHP